MAGSAKISGTRASDKHRISFNFLKNSIDLSVFTGHDEVPSYVEPPDRAADKLNAKSDKQIIDDKATPAVAVTPPLFSYQLQPFGATCQLQQLCSNIQSPHLLSLFVDEVDFWPLIYSSLYDCVRVVGGSTYQRLLYDLTSLAGNGLLSATNGSHYDVIDHEIPSPNGDNCIQIHNPVLIQFTIFYVPQSVIEDSEAVKNACSPEATSVTSLVSTTASDVDGKGAQGTSSMAISSAVEKSEVALRVTTSQSSSLSVRPSLRVPLHPLKSTKKSPGNKTKTRENVQNAENDAEQIMSYAENLFDDDAKMESGQDGVNRRDGDRRDGDRIDGDGLTVASEAVTSARVCSEQNLAGDRTLWNIEWKSPSCRHSFDCLDIYLDTKRQVWSDCRQTANWNRQLRKSAILNHDFSNSSTSINTITSNTGNTDPMNCSNWFPIIDGPAEHIINCKCSCSQATLMRVRPTCASHGLACGRHGSRPCSHFYDIRLMREKRRRDQDVFDVQAIEASTTSSSSTLSDAVADAALNNTHDASIARSSPEPKGLLKSNLPPDTMKDKTVADAGKQLPTAVTSGRDVRLQPSSDAVTKYAAPNKNDTAKNDETEDEDKCVEPEREFRNNGKTDLNKIILCQAAVGGCDDVDYHRCRLLEVTRFLVVQREVMSVRNQQTGSVDTVTHVTFSKPRHCVHGWPAQATNTSSDWSDCTSY